MQLPNTFLSLRQMSLSNIALQVFNDPDVRLFTNTHDIHACIWSSEEIEALLGKEPTILLKRSKIHDIFLKKVNPTFPQECKHLFKGDGKFHSLPNKQWEILLNQKLSTLTLPNMFKKEIVALVRIVVIESYIWFQDHKSIIKSTKNLHNHFQWTQDNKIDRQKTAKAIIHDDSIYIIDRFILASQYCFQEDVLSIWGILDDAQKDIFQEGDFNIVQIWANWAKNEEELDWEEITRHSRFGLERYFPKLQQEKRLKYLMSYRRGVWINYHELQFCLSILDRNEQTEIFKKCPFPILEVFLDWPVQEKLLDVVELLWPYLSKKNFCDFFYLILSQKRMLNWIGHDYVTLVKKLWMEVQIENSKILESDIIFNNLRLVLEYNGTRPSLQELGVRSIDDSFVAFISRSTALVISMYESDYSRFMSRLSGILYLYNRVNMKCFISA